MAKRNFLTLLDCSQEELNQLITRASDLKRKHLAGEPHQPLAGKTAALILAMNSTRTRVAFEAGMQQLGGHAIFLGTADTQIGRGEPIDDMAKVLSGMVDIAMIRTASHEDVELFAANADIPVINAMTSLYHPCQLLADMQTFIEARGPVEGRSVAFVGDGYNMCNSYINAARQWGFDLKIATPEGYEPDAGILQSTNNAQLAGDAREAVENADLVVTDVWSSMGHEEEQARRVAEFAPYQVNEALLDHAKDDALFMHCLPAHRGEEVNDTILDDPRSAVWEEAGNRLHSQKALMEFLLT
ncbi:MAG: ornithine carbamoyltransferase [Pseudomonadales bacterium]|mgnify:CR=1 FL=1|jgi:ornithine carbamoyltransferase|nr:ornithine carbamoyltransferase [Pseudomonadales bacterium]MDP6472008.1 ornithine carbamoyltransferase [Pseudomonadales bacterium]MDP6826719.1 ornithine carbamoyltransferase [Pseudomonadales bacterium]MDP6972653.1 ornithine carbamoyltransferase [Pseudomonadales bacterium]